MTPDEKLEAMIFVLTTRLGRPPTEEEINDFVASDSMTSRTEIWDGGTP